MNDISEAERLALIANEQVRLVLQEAELVEIAALEAQEGAAIRERRAKLDPASEFIKRREAERTNTVYIDWMTGGLWEADIIPFPDPNAGGKE
jgi:hypothetical protein